MNTPATPQAEDRMLAVDALLGLRNKRPFIEV